MPVYRAIGGYIVGVYAHNRSMHDLSAYLRDLGASFIGVDLL